MHSPGGGFGGSYEASACSFDSPRLALTFHSMNHEEEVVRAFFDPKRRERNLEFLGTPKRRLKLISPLAHFKALNPNSLVGIPPNQQNPSSMTESFIRMGAGPRCWVISENLELDAREMDLRKALEETPGRQMGTIISCLAGKRGSFEDQDARYILRRNAPLRTTRPGSLASRNLTHLPCGAPYPLFR